MISGAISVFLGDLISSGLTSLADAVFDKGEDFVKDKIKQVTGIEIKDSLTQEQVDIIKSKEEDILPLLQEKNRHDEKILAFQEAWNEEETKRRDLATSKYINTDHKVADEIALKIIKENVYWIMLCIVIELVAIVYLQDNGNLLAVISGIFGSAITYLYQERQSVINFHFGSSLGSKIKDAFIRKEK